MAVIGFLGLMVLAAAALFIGCVTAWGGWRALRGELLPGFRTVPPRPRTVALTIVGVLIPVLAIVAFTVYLAAQLLRVGVAALA